MTLRLLTAAEAAWYCGLTEKAIRHRVDRGAIPVKRLGVRTLRFDPRALDCWMHESARAALLEELRETWALRAPTITDVYMLLTSIARPRMARASLRHEQPQEESCG